eukprot:3932556-Rhodomonas_salina.1
MPTWYKNKLVYDRIDPGPHTIEKFGLVKFVPPATAVTVVQLCVQYNTEFARVMSTPVHNTQSAQTVSDLGTMYPAGVPSTSSRSTRGTATTSPGNHRHAAGFLQLPLRFQSRNRPSHSNNHGPSSISQSGQTMPKHKAFIGFWSIRHVGAANT